MVRKPVIDNRSFWNSRYETLPEIGSGPGSRGYAAKYKHDFIKAMVAQHAVRSIWDIGCGDLCWLDDDIVKTCAYTGIDVSEVVIAQNAAKYPTARFLLHDIAAAPLEGTADLVVCFDVLIHQLGRPLFMAALENILKAVSGIALVSYSTPPLEDGSFPPPLPVQSYKTDEETLASETAFQAMHAGLPKGYARMPAAFHGPLPELVHTLRPDFAVVDIAQYRRQTVYRITAAS